MAPGANILFFLFGGFLLTFSSPTSFSNPIVIVGIIVGAGLAHEVSDYACA